MKYKVRGNHYMYRVGNTKYYSENLRGLLSMLITDNIKKGVSYVRRQKLMLKD